MTRLSGDDRFIPRHIGPTPQERAEMLSVLGVDGIDELMDAVVPPSIRWDKPLELGPPISESAMLAHLRSLADRNQVLTSLIGTGYTNTITPPVIQRNVVEDPAWYTAYTPYQPEISQGRLEALLNFQTMVADLAGCDLANASLLDEGTAAAEAMAMAKRLAPGAGDTFLVDADCHPQTLAVIATRARPLGIQVRSVDLDEPLELDGAFGLLVQYPGSSGRVRDLAPLVEAIHSAGGLACVAADILALVALTPPGKVGADIVVGSTQRFGVPMGYGGPHAGYMATRDAYQRNLPGRLVGVSVDSSGRTAFRLALQTREQHIRRERATSNICTAQVLLAVVSGLYAVWHGPEGLRRIAARVHELTTTLAAGLRSGGVEVLHDSYFDTLTIREPGKARQRLAAGLSFGLNLRLRDDDTIGITLDETSTPDVVERVWAAFDLDRRFDSVATPESSIPPRLVRTEPMLAHPVFNSYHSETEMLRYLRRLADRDLALDRTMIPLGSCTMKLNATAEMIPITWREFSDIHPFVPAEQASGYHQLFDDLERMLAEITGYDAVSLQPNAGSQGELAGLLAIRAFQESEGQGARDVCLIPASAHGTNAASASMAGMKVVVVPCDEDGNVDVEALREAAAEHSERLSCLMVTYPSTHGVFEAAVVEMCEIVHDNGGQVYLDGANLNALVGLAKPGQFGADVSHLNLHKTFCIPHGGGGPGVGPVAARAHLAPFLPNHPLVPEAGPSTGIGPISAGPWGSAGILPISWAYITMMGAEGLAEATAVAILSANYVAHRLAEHFPILYAGSGSSSAPGRSGPSSAPGRSGLVAHECIVDMRPLTRSTGITAEDVAKRLVDHGFHAPTMSFPVAGTLMVEPTESEGKAELDRFCDAMASIRAEIDKVASGEWPEDDNPLVNAPHTAEDLLAEPWTHPYERSLGAFPGGPPGREVGPARPDKYWPPVSRIDNAYGDRNVMCSCPPMEAYDD